ncbi:FliO/MopB family protein [Caldicoprobacter algeriensis]|uniref:FliO/MopB family protein n=1 Tax=Caldicoprobacter algeriensis TaxID=699281 RepID=UPI00207AB0F1|nr:flagellar biosynthetic protein FliO [Caldicoprobacter algeriensis]
MSETMEEILRAIGILIAFIVVLVLAYLTARFVGTKFAGYTSGKYIRIIDRIFLGKDKWVCIIQVGSQYYIVGITSQNMEFLGQISQQELIPLHSEGKNGLFANLLGNYLKKLKGEADGDG